MKPGIDYDRIIAQKVMGWSDRRMRLECWPRYSSDITAAWLVVDKLVNDGYRFLAVKGPISHDTLVCFSKDLVNYKAEHASDAFAICMAALKAVGVISD